MNLFFNLLLKYKIFIKKNSSDINLMWKSSTSLSDNWSAKAKT